MASEVELLGGQVLDYRDDQECQEESQELKSIRSHLVEVEPDPENEYAKQSEHRRRCTDSN